MPLISWVSEILLPQETAWNQRETFLQKLKSKKRLKTAKEIEKKIGNITLTKNGNPRPCGICEGCKLDKNCGICKICMKYKKKKMLEKCKARVCPEQDAIRAKRRSLEDCSKDLNMTSGLNYASLSLSLDKSKQTVDESTEADRLDEDNDLGLVFKPAPSQRDIKF